MVGGVNILLFLLGCVLSARLVMWQIFRNMESVLMDGLSSILIASAILLIAIVWLSVKVIKKQLIAVSGLELPLLIFLGSAGCSLLYTVDFSKSLPSVLVLIASIIFFYVLLDLLNSIKRIQQFLCFFLGMTVVVALYGLFSYVQLWTNHADQSLQLSNNTLYYLTLHRRAISFFGWPNTLAGYLLLFIPLIIILPFYLRIPWQRIIAAFCLFVCIACFLFTFSFLGWLSLLLAILFTGGILLRVPTYKVWLKQYQWLIVPGLIIFLALFVVVIVHKDFMSSLTPRLFYYQTAFKLLWPQWVFGYGWDTFGTIMKSFVTDKNNLTTYVHNSYLQIWLEAGILGLGAIVFLFINVYRQVKEGITGSVSAAHGVIRIALACGLLAFLIDNVFSFTLLKHNVALYWWAMLAVYVALMHVEKKQRINAVVQHHFFNKALLLGFIVVFIVLIRLVMGYVLYNQSQEVRVKSSLADAVEKLNTAARIDPWSSYIPAELGSIYLEGYNTNKNQDILKLAEQSYLEANQRSPKEYYNFFALGVINSTLGNKERAYKFNREAQLQSPAQYTIDSLAVQK